MKMRIHVAVYVIAGIVTYGHARHRFWQELPSDEKAKGGVLTLSLGSALFWPLYWSSVFWNKEVK